MSRVMLCLLLFITLLFQTCEANSQGYNEDTEEKLKPLRGNTATELIKQSICRPRETLVKVCEEFPEEIQYTIVPRCVPVKRCLGCCSDEATSCIPQENKTVELQVIRVYSDTSREAIMLPFVMHTSCSCSAQESFELD